jgi:hypothetical protein
MKRVLVAMVIAVVFASAASVEAGLWSRLRARREIGGNREIARVVRPQQPTHLRTLARDNSATFRNNTRAAFVNDTRLTTEDTHVCRVYGPMEVEPGLYVYYAVKCPSRTPVAYYSESPNLSTGGYCSEGENSACEEIGSGGRAELNDAVIRPLHSNH